MQHVQLFGRILHSHGLDSCALRQLCTGRLLLLPHLQGYAPGFPVLLPLQLSQARSAAAMQYLLDGNYLDKQSAGLSAQLLVYNADLRILGHVKIDFQWRDDGSIKGKRTLSCFVPCTQRFC
jgi:hypothetical protein